MEDKIEQIKNDIESFLMDSIEHQDKKIDYILYNSKIDETITVASNGLDEMIEFSPYSKELQNGFTNVAEWDYNFDEYIFKELQKGYEVKYMTPEVHYNIWNTLKDLYPEDINNIDGVQVYLNYCKDNKITKEFIDKEMKLDTPDIMVLLGTEPMKAGEYIEYKGFVGEVDEQNDDNPKESIVYIYKSNQDMIDGNYIEQVSLCNDNIKNYIKEYIDDNLYDETIDKENDESYITFVLGYDILRDIMKDSPMPECDVNYDFCSRITNEFIQSDYYKDSSHSMYDMLTNWINDNKQYIQDRYDKYVGKESKNRSLDNGMYIIDLGYRKTQPIALVERDTEYGKEYIVAFNYRIKDNKIDWAYGYYYNDDIDKATKDFHKVLLGGNLSKTFEKKDNER